MITEKDYLCIVLVFFLYLALTYILDQLDLLSIFEIISLLILHIKNTNCNSTYKFIPIPEIHIPRSLLAHS